MSGRMNVWQKHAYNVCHCTLSLNFPLRARLEQHVARAVIVLLTSHGRDRCLIAIPLTCSTHGLRYLLLKPIWRATETVKFPLTSLKVRSSFIPGCELIRFNDTLSPDCVRPLNIVVENVTELRTYLIIRVCLLRACGFMASECGTAHSFCDPEKSPSYWTLDDSWLRIKGNPIHALHSTDQTEVSNFFRQRPRAVIIGWFSGSTFKNYWLVYLTA